MELSLLYYFKTVAEQENITKAAELLYISQPALSKAIAKLEKSLDVTLFERRKGRISLSAMGGSTTNMCPRHFRYWKPEKRSWKK